MASRVSRRVYAPPPEHWLVDEDTAERKASAPANPQDRDSSKGLQGKESLEGDARHDIHKDTLLEKLLKAGLREEFQPYRHQVEGLKWMLGQEERTVPLKGGILAGELGDFGICLHQPHLTMLIRRM